MKSKANTFQYRLTIKIMLAIGGILIFNTSLATTRQWPEGVKEIKYKSSADDTMQPAMFYAPETKEAVPLLVALHTWSENYKEPNIVISQWCINKKWAFIYPDFRGPNWTPQAMGSELAVQDIIDAVDYAKKYVKVNPERIYLLGGSGGGYAALLMAGRAPQIWAAVSAWCPITDLKKWYQQRKGQKIGYWRCIEKACGGIPGIDPNADNECIRRSAATYLAKAKNVKIEINAGIHDGHTGSVPISHAFEAYNILAAPNDRISEKDIKYFVEKQAVPPGLKMEKEENVYNTKHKIHFRKTSENVKITIFEGGHWILFDSALYWLEQQKKSDVPVWNVKSKFDNRHSESGTELGK